MKKLKIRKTTSKSKKKESELATEVGNVRVDEVEIERSDMAHKAVDELERANVDVDVGQKGPPITNTSYKESLSANPRSKTDNSAAISTLNLTANERAHIEQQDPNFDDSSDDDYSCGNEDEYEDDVDLFADNIVYGLDDVFISDDEIRLVVDKEIDEENNRDIYYNGEGDELESDDGDLGAVGLLRF